MNVTKCVVSGNSAVSVCCRDCIERATQIETEKDRLTHLCCSFRVCFVGCKCLLS